MGTQETARRGTRDDHGTVARRVGWPGLLLVAGAWGAFVPLLPFGPSPGLAVEVVDHVLPGGVVLIVSMGSIVRRVRGTGDEDGLALVSAALATLAGTFMAVAHLPLLAQNLRGPGLGVLVHALPGLLIVAVAGPRTVRLFARY